MSEEHEERNAITFDPWASERAFVPGRRSADDPDLVRPVPFVCPPSALIVEARRDRFPYHLLIGGIV